MYIAETLINPLFTDVAFRRDSEGDGSGHYESGGVMSPPSLVPSARLVSMGRVSVTISYSFHCLTTETVKYTNETVFFAFMHLADAFIQSDLQCIQAMHFLSVCVFYWEFSFIKIQYVGTERETNVIINNKCTFCIFRRRAALCAKI